MEWPMPAGVIHFGDGDVADGSDGKEMAWSELTGWTIALTRLTRDS
jgi:hypothetical protein